MNKKIDLLDYQHQHLENYLPKIFPRGVIRGREFIVGNIEGDAGESLSINIDTGLGADFASGDKFNIISLIAKKYNLTTAKASEKIKEDWEIKGEPTVKKDKKSYTPLIPADAPFSISTKFFGEPATIWEYKNLQQQIIGYVARFNKEDGKKDFRFFILAKEDNKWHAQHLRPEPIYNAHELLNLDPERKIIIHEGEKAADAGVKLCSHSINITWAGGAQAAQLADWSIIPMGSKIIILRDNDEPGVKAQNIICERLFANKCHIGILKPDAMGDKPEGWDCADALASGIEAEEYTDWLLANLIDYRPGREAGAELVAQSDSENIPAPKAPVNNYYKLLGMNGADFLFYNFLGGQVYSIEYNKLEKKFWYVLSNGDTNYWWKAHGEKIIDEKTGKEKERLDWDKVMAKHVGQAHKLGQYALDKLRGRGTWRDDDRFVTNTGEYLYISGKKVPIHNYASDYIYIKKSQLIHMEEELPQEALSKILLMCNSANWEIADAAKLFAGWLMIAPIAGALEWRPHIYLCGMAGSGKTTLYEKVISPLLDKFKYSFTGDTTAPGIRRLTRGDSMPITIDEFEINARNDDSRIAAILDLARASSDANEAISAKAGMGSSNSVTYNLTAAFCFISITPSAKNFADITRISPLALRTTAEQDNYRKLVLLSAELQRIKKLSDKFITYSNKQITNILASHDIIHDTAIKLKLFSARIADQVGTLLAGYWAYEHQTVITEKQATKLLEELNIASIIPQKDEENQYRLLSKIAQYTVYFSNEAVDRPRQFHRTIADLAEYVAYADPYSHKDSSNYSVSIADRLLRNMGIRFSHDLGGIAIANSSEALQKILTGTQWANNWNHSLKSISGAKVLDTPIRFSTSVGTQRGIVLPLDALIGAEEIKEVKAAIAEEIDF